MHMRMWVIGSLLLAGCWTSTQAPTSSSTQAPAPEPAHRDPIQPINVEKREASPDIASGDPDGVEGGVEGGVVGGDLDNVPGSMAPPPPPPPPPPPSGPRQRVAPTALEASRIAGSKVIPPDAPLPPGHTFAAAFDMCIDTNGSISEARVVKSTGVSAYDAKIVDTLRREWRYRPLVVNGKVAPVCTTINFISK